MGKKFSGGLDSLREYILDRCCPEPNTGCWLWTASLYSNGYGQSSLVQYERKAHRLSYEVFVGPLTPGMSVCHKCDTPSCVNPDHLFLGTHQENMQDRSRKGRTWNKPRWVGTKNPRTLLTEEQVTAIRRLHSEGLAYTTLAGMYGMQPSGIRKIVKRLNWAHVT